jgi:hypothetical protein
MTPPICPPPRTALWLAEEARLQQAIEVEQLRQAILAEPVRATLGELVWDDFNRQRERATPSAGWPGPLPPSPPTRPPLPAAAPIPPIFTTTTQKGANHA